MSKIKSEPWIHYIDELKFEYKDKDYSEKQVSSQAMIDILAPVRNVNIKEFESCSFIEKYKGYYYRNQDEDNYPKKNCPKRINARNQSSEDVEKIFFGEGSIFEKDTWEKADVLNILAWKTGNIDYAKSSKNKIIYKDGWLVDEVNKNYGIKLRSYSLSGKDFEDFADIIIDLRKDYSSNSIDDNTLRTELMNEGKNVKGLGTVYLITLLFFITKGRYPIYDRFAMAALLSLLAEKNGGCIPHDEGIIRNTTLPELKYCKDLNEIKLYNTYKGLLYHFFGEEWKSNRDIDRALWVYGHYFDVPQ